MKTMESFVSIYFGFCCSTDWNVVFSLLWCFAHEMQLKLAWKKSVNVSLALGGQCELWMVAFEKNPHSPKFRAASQFRPGFSPLRHCAGIQNSYSTRPTRPSRSPTLTESPFCRLRAADRSPHFATPANANLLERHRTLHGALTADLGYQSSICPANRPIFAWEQCLSEHRQWFSNRFRIRFQSWIRIVDRRALFNGAKSE